MRFVVLISVSMFFLASCRGQTKNEKLIFSNQDSSLAPKFQILEFESDGKINSASVDTRYKNFTHKEEFPISLFVTINGSDKEKNNLIEKSIVDAVRKGGVSAFIGHVNMPDFRDVIFYIRKDDQKNIAAKLSEQKSKTAEIKEFVFEEDPQWEAVSEFYQAVK